MKTLKSVNIITELKIMKLKIMKLKIMKLKIIKLKIMKLKILSKIKRKQLLQKTILLLK